VHVADAGKPWLRNTRSAYSSVEHAVSRPLTWSAAVNRSLITFPRKDYNSNFWVYWKNFKMQKETPDICC